MIRTTKHRPGISPNRGPGFPIKALQDAPAWLGPRGQSSEEAWWPCGRLTYTKRNGDTVDGVLVIAVGTDVRLLVIDRETRVKQARDWPAPDKMGGLYETTLKQASALASAIIHRHPVNIGYTKKDDKPELPRLIIVGSGTDQGPKPDMARHLYTDEVFRAAVDYAESTGQQWRILSLEYGLLHPDLEVAPYEKLQHWGVTHTFGERFKAHVEMHGMRDQPVQLLGSARHSGVLTLAEVEHEAPLDGLLDDECLAWFRKHRRMDVRRLDKLVPHANGLSVVAHDLDRDAPRTFRLDRIKWVEVRS